MQSQNSNQIGGAKALTPAEQAEIDAMVDFTITKETLKEFNSNLPDGVAPFKVGEIVKLPADHSLLKKNEPTFVEPAEEEINFYGVYTKSGVLVKKYNPVQHGKDFIKLAKAFAERNEFVAKVFVEPLTPEEQETDVVHIVTSNGEKVRTYSLAVHGKDYEKLAAGFVDKYKNKKGYRVK